MSIIKTLFTTTCICAGLMTNAAAAGDGAGQKPQLREGTGRGFVIMPTTQFEGWFNADLLDERGQVCFTISAQMTTFVPTTTFGPGVRVLYGGIYGTLHEVPPPGVHLVAPMSPIAMVEGYWMLEHNNTGSFEVSTYVRQSGGGYRLTGSVSGDMLVSEITHEEPEEEAGSIQAMLKKKAAVAGQVVRSSGLPAVSSQKQKSASKPKPLAKVKPKASQGGSASAPSPTAPMALAAAPSGVRRHDYLDRFETRQAVAGIAIEESGDLVRQAGSVGSLTTSTSSAGGMIVAATPVGSVSQASALGLSRHAVDGQPSLGQTSSEQGQAIGADIGGLARATSAGSATGTAQGQTSSGGAPSPVLGLRIGEFRLAYRFFH